MIATCGQVVSIRQLPSIVITKWLSSFLVGISLMLGTLSCNHDQALTPRSTDQIARLQEWHLSAPASNTANLNLADSLTWMKLGDAYYYISTSTSSTFVYDGQNRLSKQQTKGYRNDTDYGRSQSNRTYSYTYSSTQLTVLREGKRLSGSYGYDSLATRQYLPLNQQGLVTSQPLFDARYSDGDNGYSGVSLLFSTSLEARAKDTLRQYDSEGYLTQTTLVSTQAVDRPWRLSQTIEAGNITGSQLTQLARSTTLTESPLSRTFCQYDLARATIPNPHQFLGTSSRNLLVKLIYYPAGFPPTSQTYRYEYDKIGRVIRYSISSELATKTTLYLIGQITYAD